MWVEPRYSWLECSHMSATYSHRVPKNCMYLLSAHFRHGRGTQSMMYTVSSMPLVTACTRKGWMLIWIS